MKATPKASRARTTLRRVLMATCLLTLLAGVAVTSPRIARASGINPLQIITVPEIDPGSLSGALTLLIGGCLTLNGRSRRD